MTDQEGIESVTANNSNPQSTEDERLANSATAGRSDLWFSIAGAVLTIFGVILVWDSLLWLFPEPYGVPCSDWKELLIALPVLGAGWFLAVRGRRYVIQKWKWLVGKSNSMFPLALSGMTLLICIVFNVEIRGPYWFTYSDIVTVQSGWRVGEKRLIRYRYAQPDEAGHCLEYRTLFR